MGLLVGFAMLGGVAAWPRMPVERLPWLAAAALGAGWLADRAGRRRIGGATVAIAALGGGWWLAGVPRWHEAGPDVVGLAAYLAVVAFALRHSGEPWHAVAAAASSYAALHLAGGPALWSIVPLVVLAAAGGQFGPAGARWVGILPLTAALTASVAVPAETRLGTAGAGRIAMAALVPIAVLLAAPWAGRRLGFAGRLPAAVVTLVAVGLLLWMAGGLAGIR